ncbi:MAG: hypothetical protein MI924_08250 [Chloroflexales bacterium]|nr:hypothetical protein [Chloroflexales bacterium]
MADGLVDTDILIEVVRSIPEAITYVQNLELWAIVAISSITYMELLQNSGKWSALWAAISLPS